MVGTDREIYVIDAEGSNVRQLTVNTDDDGQPAWDRKARKLANAIRDSSHRHGRLESLVVQHLVKRVDDLGEVALVRHHLVDVLVRVRVLVE